MGRLDGRAAIVTGGAKGIGRHYSFALAAEGARVMIADIADGSDLAAEIAARHGANSVAAEAFDVSDEKAVKTLSGLFHAGIKKGDPTCFHVAIYLGEGRTAEAHGGDLSTARVGARGIDAHAGSSFASTAARTGRSRRRRRRWRRRGRPAG